MRGSFSTDQSKPERRVLIFKDVFSQRPGERERGENRSGKELCAELGDSPVLEAKGSLSSLGSMLQCPCKLWVGPSHAHISSFQV